MSSRGGGGGNIKYIQLVDGVFSSWGGGVEVVDFFQLILPFPLAGPQPSQRPKKKKVMSV